MKIRKPIVFYVRPILLSALATSMVLSFILFLSSCKKDETPPAPTPPTITSFSPTSGNGPVAGGTGTLVTITGSNFSTTAASNQIKFNGTAATTASATATQLTATVPQGATTGKITVTVNGLTATSSSDFVVNQSPTIASFTPASGLVGATVTITGTNFSATAASNTVKFNNTAATVSTATATQLTVAIPASATTGKITVTVNDLTATSATDFTVLLPPTVTSFSPAYALPGASVTVTGTNFSTTPANNAVTISNIVATVTAATPTQLTVTVPALATTGKISVTTNTVTATSANNFEVLKDIPRNGLIAFYPFNGNANDASGNNLNGTLNGPLSTANRFGTTDKAYNFNGTSDFISMGNPPLLQISNTITLSGWINIDAYKAGNSPMYILTKIFFDPNQGGNPTKGYSVYQDFTGGGTPTPTLGVTGFSSLGLTLSNFVGSTISTGTWIHFTLIIDGKSWKFYQNGVFTHGTTAVSTVNILDDGSLGELVIGKYSGGFFFDGNIDDIAIYNRALSDAEVTQLYNQTVSKY
jgi:Concanavalin A-like lectin/glucanases superfamily/IPT/TIG domain